MKIGCCTATIRRGGVCWDNGVEAAVHLSDSADQENGQGFQTSPRPKINSDNRRVITTGNIPAAQPFYVPLSALKCVFV